MSFRITGLSPVPFQRYFGLPDAELASLGIRRVVVDEAPGFPDRIEMREAAVGETVLLLNHTSPPADTPYRASHAMFVRESASRRYDAIDQVSDVMRRRLLSLRAFDADATMVDADTVEGSEMEGLIERLLANPATCYIHAHNDPRS
ncbi:DUF1203 domain-containing protein [Ancylobacter defluvii]|uniref:Uncharacterized protein n=1 Tax=Ancylobacter defluvii TaxID=1282440 RepID=A0A9W6NDG9_9HYPH|nr:DUF1203 domain-containing protein [Ancylobacter defluvii]MBS7588139.1 DUF1203 domain-containing protein [Ancylobacter defluvii]GLK86531.1 hypothetical protein GCM10017653_46010 [Ancylobacter defluvii]